MAGTRKGGLKAAATNKQRYGLGFYPRIGRKGGTLSTGGAFTNQEFAREMGRKGGTTPRKLATHCRRGHEHTRENTKIVVRIDGTHYRRCLDCVAYNAT